MSVREAHRVVGGRAEAEGLGCKRRKTTKKRRPFPQGFPLLVCLFLLFGVFLYFPDLSLPEFWISSIGWISSRGGLRTDGRWVIDSKGDIVILRGANFPGYGQANWKSHTLEDYERMKKWGFNVVRIPIGWNYIEPKPGVYNSSYLDIIDRDIAWAKEVGMFIILDMHQWKWSPYFTFTADKRNGMPIWLVSGYDNSAEGMAQAITDFWIGRAPNGTEATQENHSMQDRFIAMWRFLATRYANETTVGAYDLFNEPEPGGILSRSETANYLFPFYEILISEIREVDTNHIIIYEAVDGWDVRNSRLLDYRNVVFSFHFYFGGDGYSGNITRLEEIFLKSFWDQPSADPIKDWSIPIWVGEFGSDTDIWARDAVSILDEYELGWAWWEYSRSSKPLALLCANGTERTYLTQYLKQA